LNDIYTLKKPLASNFLKKETDRPFDDTTRFEKICKRNTCGLFVFGSRTKSHPTRLVFGRTFDEMLMDMIELDVSSYVAASTFKNVEAPALGAKPLIVFQGPSFSHNPQAERLRSMLLDSFRGASPQEIALESVQHTIVITAVEKENAGLIFNFRVYRLALKKTGSKLPFADLVEISPRLRITPRLLLILTKSGSPKTRILRQTRLGRLLVRFTLTVKTCRSYTLPIITREEVALTRSETESNAQRESSC
jgi:ribosome production factor 2